MCKLNFLHKVSMGTYFESISRAFNARALEIGTYLPIFTK